MLRQGLDSFQIHTPSPQVFQIPRYQACRIDDADEMRRRCAQLHTSKEKEWRSYPLWPSINSSSILSSSGISSVGLCSDSITEVLAAMALDSTVSTVIARVGSPGYVAPEIIRGNRYNELAALAERSG